MIRDQIKRARKARNLTQGELASLLGKNVSWVKNVETRTTRFDPADLVALGKVLRIELDSLLGKKNKAA